ncbi:MAG: type II secretion system F family protein [Halobacteriota archaeon]
MVLEFVPLAVVVLIGAAMVLSRYVEWADTLITRVSLVVFGDFVRRRTPSNHQQRQWLESAHVGTTYRVYAAKTYTFVIVAAVVGTVLGVYAIRAAALVLRATAGGGRFVESIEATMPGAGEWGLVTLALTALVSSATVGVLSAFGTYQLRWAIPRFTSGERERRIDNSLKRNVAFMFALSRSGMPFPDILRVLADNRVVYGETADEVAVAVRDIDLFGTDVLTTIRRLRDRTPSRNLEDLAENLASVLQSGQSLSAFLRDQYEHYKDEEEAQQQAFLELLGTLAEAYVTVFVAGPLFLITILVVIGLMLGGTLEFLRVLVYAVIPLATLGFIVYLDSITEDVKKVAPDPGDETQRVRFSDIRVVPDDARTPMTDGGRTATDANRYRLDIYRRVRPLLDSLREPGRMLAERPTALLWATVPIGLVWTLLQWWPHLLAGDPTLALYDDPLVQSALFVIGTFAITHEVANRRVKAIEAAIPDFLDRLASTNEAGMSIVESFGRVVASDLGSLSSELERTWADITWGARVEDALQRLQYRVATPAITRVVTLTTNAMEATNDIGQVLRIAADEAQATRRLERERRNEMLTYTVVVYISFFVFLVIVVALDTIFVPAIPTGGLGGGGTGGVPGAGLPGGIQQLTEAQKDAYSLVFFHGALIQSVASGFVAGQMGSGSLKSGAKHATFLLAIAYALFLVIG